MALRKICLQAGHQNTKDHCDPAMRGSTGAPGEVENNIRIRDRLSQILLSKKNADGTPAFTLQLVDAKFSCDPNAGKTDYALFLSLHCEADVHNADGGMISAPDPSQDSANAESKRIAQAIREEYFPHAGITERPSWVSNNMTFYYMWKFLSAKTPCALLEMGVAQNAHDKVILADTDRVANAIARGICKAFGVQFDTPTPVPPTPPATNWEQKYNDEVNAHTATKEAFKKFKEDSATDKTNAVKAETERVKGKILDLANSL